jgi:hypothetical protein
LDELSAVKEEGLLQLIVTTIAKEAVTKSNHPIQNPLLLVTEPQTEHNIYVIFQVLECYEIAFASNIQINADFEVGCHSLF